MKLAESKVAILVDDYFEQSEFEEPLKFLKNLGVAVTVVATNHKQLTALRYVNRGDSFAADELLADTDTDSYDALVLPVGAINADALRMVKRARQWAQRHMDEDKLIAAICHAPWLLASADVVEGQRLTSFFTLQDDLRNAGAEWIDQPVVEDNNLITSRKPDDLPKFNEAIEHWLRQAEVKSRIDR